MVGGAKSRLESNPIPARDTSRAQTKPCAPGPRDPTEAEPGLGLSVSCRGPCQQWPSAGAGALGAARYRTHTGLGEQTLGGHRQNLVRTKTQEEGAVTPQETDPDLPVSVQESLAEAWVGSGLLQGWGH